MKILVVDDEEDFCELLKLNLNAYGFDVECALSGREGLEKAVKDLPDAIVLDIRMPDMNGWKVIQSLKADKRTNGIPVIFLTASLSDSDGEKAKRAGAYRLLTKPYDPVDLVKLLMEI